MGNYNPYLGKNALRTIIFKTLKNLNQFDLTDICKTGHSTRMLILFKCTWKIIICIFTKFNTYCFLKKFNLYTQGGAQTQPQDQELHPLPPESPGTP